MEKLPLINKLFNTRYHYQQQKYLLGSGCMASSQQTGVFSLLEETRTILGKYVNAEGEHPSIVFPWEHGRADQVCTTRSNSCAGRFPTH